MCTMVQIVLTDVALALPFGLKEAEGAIWSQIGLLTHTYCDGHITNDHYRDLMAVVL